MMEGMLGFLLNTELLSTWGMRLVWGLGITAKVVLISCAAGFLLAFPICRARMSKSVFLAWPALAYTTFFRGTPLLCQLYIVYYGMGEIRPFLQDVGLWWFFRDAFYCCIFAFSLNTAAYQAEIMRGALLAVPKGQREAAAALGLPAWPAALRVVWPQAALVALRPFGNEYISMVKASALAAIVTLLDLMGQTRFVFARTFDFSVYLYAALIYLAITETIRRVWNAIERKLSRHLLAGRPEAPASEAVTGHAPTPAAAAPIAAH